MNKKLKIVLKYASVIILLLIIFLPFYWILISSLKPTHEILSPIPTFFPEEFTLMHYESLLQTTQFNLFLRNSFFVSLMTTLVTIVLATAAGYSIHRCNYPFRKAVFFAILSIYIFPRVLLIIPLYRVMVALRLINTLWSLVLINVAICAPFSVWLLRSFFNSIPEAIEDAASIDGANKLQILYKVFLPLAKPGIATIAIFTFLFSWTEYLFSTMFIHSESLQTLPVGVSRFITQYQIDWGLVNSASIATALPPLIVFALVGRYFVEGLTKGAVR